MALKQGKTLIYINNNHQKESLIFSDLSIEIFNVYIDNRDREKFQMGQVLSVCFKILPRLLKNPKTTGIKLNDPYEQKSLKIIVDFLNKEVLASAHWGAENEVVHLKSFIQFITMCANNREHCTLWDLERFHNIIDEPMVRCRTAWNNIDDYSDVTLDENDILKLLEKDKERHKTIIGNIKANMKEDKETYKNLPPELQKILNQYKRTGMLGNNTNYYEIKSIIDLLSACLQEIFKADKCIAICEHCGRLFIPPHRRDTKYCSFPSPENSNRNCKEQVRLENQIKRDNAKESAKMHKIIRTMYANKYGETSGELNNFLNDSRDKRDLIKEGKLTEDEYVTWLKTFFVRKYK